MRPGRADLNLTFLRVPRLMRREVRDIAAWPGLATNCQRSWDEGDVGEESAASPSQQEPPGRAALRLGGALGHSITS